ncbi:thioesterase family domain containing protein [Acanthamoeba castellanii str. Neff]|uniref:Acyl-coenzyme A thioesterase THEM4 n=1 Tax=Acanthamoeba castellanii (strain ATCC 30010 / Neff) TaxID=1257118 RepID=L8H3L5_ACACF|nr:thioesterase family domain containing protein [Acanthamoeba castellanii str. Neff]ELR19016.1 thioesterase family domain containing protein [Acanthamoeba castellanii str. Neff]
MLRRRLPSLETAPTHLSGTRQRRAEVQADPRWRAINLPSLEDRRALGARGEHYVWQDSKFEGFELYFNDEARSAMGFIDFGTRCEGPPGCVHGGALATIFDNVLGSTVVEGLKGQRAVTLNLDVNYRKIIETRIDRVEGRKVYVTATLTDGEDGTLHADASALFLVVNLQQIRDQIHKGNNSNRPSS